MCTCLFTGEQLSSTTKEEHTLPRALGGRIRSREVSSDTFNNAAGNRVDRHLVSAYSMVLNRLGPLLASEHKPGNMPVVMPGEQKGLILDKSGSLTRKGVAIVERDPVTRLPKKIKAGTREDLKRIAKTMRLAEPGKIEVVPATPGKVVFARQPALMPELEIGALKSAMLTFDHVLKSNTNRFTRDAALSDLRQFVRTAIIEGTIDQSTMSQCSLGLQYEKLPLYRAIREGLKFPMTPFEHILLVSANVVSHCIDLVWIVLNSDPYGFRLHRSWKGKPFAYAIINSVVRGGTSSQAIPFDPPEDLLCRPTDRRSYWENPMSKIDTERIVGEIFEHRNGAFCEALWQVETTCDQHVREMLCETALVDGPLDRRMRELITDRVARCFEGPQPEDRIREKAKSAMSDACNGISIDVLEQSLSSENAIETIDWLTWLKLYRRCLDDLRVEFGLPGYTTAGNIDVKIEDLSQQELGRPPL